MPRVRLLHLRPLEAVERIAALHALGYDVLFDPLDDRESLKRVWQTPPDAYVFDITRVPSHMRELAISLRERKTTRRVPMVFAGGDPAKVARLREGAAGRGLHRSGTAWATRLPRPSRIRRRRRLCRNRCSRGTPGRRCRRSWGSSRG